MIIGALSCPVLSISRLCLPYPVRVLGRVAITTFGEVPLQQTRKWHAEGRRADIVKVPQAEFINLDESEQQRDLYDILVVADESRSSVIHMLSRTLLGVLMERACCCNLCPCYDARTCTGFFASTFWMSGTKQSTRTKSFVDSNAGDTFLRLPSNLFCHRDLFVGTLLETNLREIQQLHKDASE